MTPRRDDTSAVSAGPGKLRGKSRKSLILGLLGLLLLVVIAAVVLAVVLAGKNTKEAKKDVTIKTCTAKPSGGKPEASGDILNHSSKTSNYVVKLKFLDAQGNSVAEGAAPVKSIDANQTATWELTGDRDAKGPVKCEITGVSRTHLPGQ